MAKKAPGQLMRRATSWVVSIVAVTIAQGCAFGLKANQCPVRTLADVGTPRVDIQYLGSGGYLVKRGTDIALFSPVYSNPTGPEVFFGHEFRSEGRLVDSLLPPAADAAQAIIIGHGHYDHLLDTPWVAIHRATSANIYGSSTVNHLLASIRPILQQRTPANYVKVVDGDAEAKRWIPIPNSRMRLLAIPSEHSDQFRLNVAGLVWPIHAFRGDAIKDFPDLPRTAADWIEGPTFAYLLDFLDDQNRPEFRIYFQDSATHSGVGLGPTSAEADYRPVDAALLCGGGEFKTFNHPAEAIARLKPRHVVIGHWEDFFITQRAVCTEGEVRGLPLADPKGVAKEARRAQKDAGKAESVFLPCPTASLFQIAIDPMKDGVRKKDEEVTYDCTKIR